MSSRLIPARWRADLLASLTGPARWWHFWNPGSGLIGGVIAGALLVAFSLWMAS